jgi:hypothetical protein
VNDETRLKEIKKYVYLGNITHMKDWEWLIEQAENAKKYKKALKKITEISFTEEEKSVNIAYDALRK